VTGGDFGRGKAVEGRLWNSPEFKTKRYFLARRHVMDVLSQLTVFEAFGPSTCHRLTAGLKVTNPIEPVKEMTLVLSIIGDDVEVVFRKENGFWKNRPSHDFAVLLLVNDGDRLCLYNELTELPQAVQQGLLMLQGLIVNCP